MTIINQIVRKTIGRHATSNLQPPLLFKEEKVAFLRTICRHVANTLCRPDAESLLVRLEARDMSLEASDLNVSTLSRTFSSLYKTKQKVGKIIKLKLAHLIYFFDYVLNSPDFST